jgi:hypothetical protein
MARATKPGVVLHIRNTTIWSEEIQEVSAYYSNKRAYTRYILLIPSASSVVSNVTGSSFSSMWLIQSERKLLHLECLSDTLVVEEDRLYH